MLTGLFSCFSGENVSRVSVSAVEKKNIDASESDEASLKIKIKKKDTFGVTSFLEIEQFFDHLEVCTEI